jgi:hypothetical protein
MRRTNLRAPTNEIYFWVNNVLQHPLDIHMRVQVLPWIIALKANWVSGISRLRATKKAKPFSPVGKKRKGSSTGSNFFLSLINDRRVNPKLLQ